MQDKLDGLQYNDRDYFQEQQGNDRCWKWPLNLAIGLHVVFFAASIVVPDLIERRPLLDNVVTVDLVSMPELAAPPPAASPAVKAPQPPKQAAPAKSVEPPPEPEVAEVSVAPKPELAPQPAAPARPISLKPLKRKIRKARDTRLAEEKDREKRARALKQQALARKKAEQARRKKAIADARRAKQEAAQAAARARQELASMIRESGAGGGLASRSGSTAGRKVQSVVLKQYLASLYERVHSYWILPEMRRWNPSLETIVVLAIRRDGSIARMEIERKSRDQFFDQFVMKTLQSAAPMPPFPRLMTQPVIEVGLRFKPGELAM